MSDSKQRRRAYRHSLVEESAFDARMRAVSGTAPCTSCTIIRFCSELDDDKICVFCRAKIPSRAPIYVVLKEVLEPGVVYVDASWRDGVAGLAIVGELGSFSDQVYTRSNVEAEVMTLRWAMNIAKRRRVSPLVFRTDSESAHRMGARAVPKWADWSVEWVPRRQNMVADRIAMQARLAA